MKDRLTQMDHPANLEAIRLINKFFPESLGHISQASGIDFYKMLDSMRANGYLADYSCDPFGIPPGPNLGLRKKGGLDGENDEAYLRLLSHCGLAPRGRVVAVPSALGKGWSVEPLWPFVCAAQTLPARLAELDYYLFNESNDVIFVFESGEAICVDHDCRVFWAISRRMAGGGSLFP